MFPAEHDFDSLIASASDAYGVPVAVIKGVIGAESGFDPAAYRAEPQINDASTGLMQLLMSTARGQGFTGTSLGLYDPRTNINLGTKLLSSLSRQLGDWGAVFSAYNGGVRPQYGLGARLPSGLFQNQDYVNRVASLVGYFGQQQADAAVDLLGPSGEVQSAGDGLLSVLPWLALPLVLALWAGKQADK